MFELLLLLGLVLAILAAFGARVVQEYERGVVFRIGRLAGVKGPGLFFVLPKIDRITVVDLRTIPMEVPPQDLITKDNVSIRVSAVVYSRVVDPALAVVRVTDHMEATFQLAQTTLRSVMGQFEMDDLLAGREHINATLQRLLDEQSAPWGVKVSAVEVKDIELPEEMKRAMARQAEAEREKRAKVIHAEGEMQASRKLAEAAAIVAANPVALQLRYLQTLTDVAAEKNSTILFPVPIDIISAFLKRTEGKAGRGGGGHRAASEERT